MTMLPADPPGFARDWIEAFNSKDLERILSHYAADVELISPIYRQFTDGRTDRVYGIGELRTYFGTALQRYPQLHFTLLEAAMGTRSLCLRYHSNLGDRIAIECFEWNDRGEVARVTCHYVG